VKTISAVKARNNFGRLLNIVSLTHTDVIIERAGKPIARLTSADKSVSPRSTGKLDWRKTRGLGKSIWRRIDADTYIQEERDQWE